MSVQSHVANVRGVAADERLHNVRTRHLHLSNLFQTLSASQAALIEATTSTFPNTSRELAELLINQTLADIHFEAGLLDQKSQNKFHADLANPSRPTNHVHSLPLGALAVAAYNIDWNPIAAIFGPTVSAIASGNALCIFTEETRFSAQVWKIFHAALDREGYVVVEQPKAKISAHFHIFDRVITYDTDVEGHERPSNIFALPGQKLNLVVIDQSIVSESVYRVKDYKPKARELQDLANAVDQIRAVNDLSPSALTAVLVSEKVAPHFSTLMAQRNIKGGKACPTVVFYRSSEHIIEELHKRSVPQWGRKFIAVRTRPYQNSLSRGCETASVYIFAAPKHAAYLARFTKHKSCIYNSLPIEVVVAHVPTSSSVQLRKDGQAVFQPLWQTELFGKGYSIISLPASGIKPNTISNLQLHTSHIAPIMKRRKPMHMEFFPTGFKITAFPFLISVAGIFGYSTYRLLCSAFRVGRQYVGK